MTIGELPICTPAQDVLAGEDFTTLSAALAAAKDVDVGDIPAGNLIVIAPTNDAFAAALEELKLTPEELLADTDLLTSILAVHVGVASGDSAESATDIAGNKLSFDVAGSPATLSAVEAATDGISITGPSNTVDVSTPLTCVGGSQVYFPSSGVLLPAAAPAPGPKPDPTPSPKPDPTPSPKPTPSSATMAGFASAIVAGAAAVLVV